MNFDPTNPLGPPSLHVAMSLALELRAMQPIAAWPPLGERLERLSASLRGGEGLSQVEIDALRTWSRRWAVLGPNLRAFYGDNASEGWASAALWHLLGGYDRPVLAALGLLHRNWRESPHHVPGIDPLPRLRNA